MLSSRNPLRGKFDQTLPLALEQNQDGSDQVASGDKVLALLPKDYLTSPFFAACPQKSGREVLCKGKLYQIGGFKAFPDAPLLPALDVRHATLLLCLMRFWNLIDAAPVLRITWSQLIDRLDIPMGGNSIASLRDLLSDLWGTAVRVRYKNQKGDSQIKTYRILESIDEEIVTAGIKRSERQLRAITFTQNFLEILRDVAEVMHTRVDVLTRIKSPLSRAIYLYLPSRAVHHSSTEPFLIKTKTLFTDIGIAAPSDFLSGGKYAFKSIRLRLLTQIQKGGSIIAQCCGAEVLTGILHLHLSLNRDGQPRLSKDDGDYMLSAWVEKPSKFIPAIRPDYKMLQAWCASGRSEAEFHNAKPIPLNPYEEDSLASAGINVENTRRFLERAKALVPDFTGIVGALVVDFRTTFSSTDMSIKDPSAVLVHRVMQRLAARPRAKQQAVQSFDGS